MTQGTVKKYKCDYCSETFKSTTQIFEHIKDDHQKCTICARIFPEAKSLETHVKAVHKNAVYKHTLERDPSLKNHKNKRFTQKISNIHYREKTALRNKRTKKFYRK